MTKLEELAKNCIENHTHRLVDKTTFEWLLDMDVYVVYHESIGSDFSEEEM